MEGRRSAFGRPPCQSGRQLTAQPLVPAEFEFYHPRSDKEVRPKRPSRSSSIRFCAALIIVETRNLLRGPWVPSIARVGHKFRALRLCSYICYPVRRQPVD